MKDLSGKTAVVTGSGSGIGRGTALALADAGMSVAGAGIDEAAAQAVAKEVGERGVRGVAVKVDVADRASVEQLAEAVYNEFGEVHVLHNNAGVGLFVRLDGMTDADWNWIISINLYGVVNGLQAFVPRMKAQDGETHVVNTASMAGMVTPPLLGAYNATKFAVVAISETLRREMARAGMGVSVLCPGGVSTNIMTNSLRQRPGGSPPARDIDLGAGDMRMMAPEDVGRLVRRAIEQNELYIFTHPEMKPGVETRFDRILQAFDYWADQQG